MSLLLFIFTFSIISIAGNFERDTIATEAEDLVITFIGHGTLMFSYGELIMHVDPVGRYADYSELPKADIILVTHHHGDHLDPSAIEMLKKDGTEIILTQACSDQGQNGIIMKNGGEKVIDGLRIQAVPAYNIVHHRESGEPYHPKGVGNGYVIHFSNFRIYIAGDTENVPEMKELAGVDCAFLPMNLPYTMTPEMVADAVEMLKPGILYPYHFGETDTGELLKLLGKNKSLDIRIRRMK
jgi:L-ascorbate metabolism protein UlaG (beta-lactamase superfamily)